MCKKYLDSHWSGGQHSAGNCCGEKHWEGDDTLENDGIRIESAGNLKILVVSDENLSDWMGTDFFVVTDGYKYKDNAAIIDNNTIDDDETLVGYESVKWSQSTLLTWLLRNCLKTK